MCDCFVVKLCLYIVYIKITEKEYSRLWINLWILVSCYLLNWLNKRVNWPPPLALHWPPDAVNVSISNMWNVFNVIGRWRSTTQSKAPVPVYFLTYIPSSENNNKKYSIIPQKSSPYSSSGTQPNLSVYNDNKKEKNRGISQMSQMTKKKRTLQRKGQQILIFFSNWRHGIILKLCIWVCQAKTKQTTKIAFDGRVYKTKQKKNINFHFGCSVFCFFLSPLSLRLTSIAIVVLCSAITLIWMFRVAWCVGSSHQVGTPHAFGVEMRAELWQRLLRWQPCPFRFHFAWV